MNSVWPGNPKSAVCSTAFAIGRVTMRACGAAAGQRRRFAFNGCDGGICVDWIRLAGRLLDRERDVKDIEHANVL